MKSSASAGKGYLKVLRGKSTGGSLASSQEETGTVVSGSGRGKSKIRMSDETFFAPDHEHDHGKDNNRPTLWELYMRPKTTEGTVPLPPTYQHQFVTGTTKAAALAEAAAAAGWTTTARNMNTNAATTTTTLGSGSGTPSRNEILRRQGSGSGGGGIMRSKSFGSLRSQRSQASSSSTHTVGMDNNPNPNANFIPNISLSSKNSTPNISHTLTHSNTNSNTQTQNNTSPVPHVNVMHKADRRRPNRLGKHKQSGSVTSLDSIPEASPALGATLLVPVGQGQGPINYGHNHNHNPNLNQNAGEHQHKHSESIASASTSRSHKSSASSASTTSSTSANLKLKSATSPFVHNGIGVNAMGVPAPPPMAQTTTTVGPTPDASPSMKQIKTTSTSPPRLSLHQHTGSDSLSLSTWWSEEVLGGLETGGWSGVGGRSEVQKESQREKRVQEQGRDGQAGVQFPVIGIRMQQGQGLGQGLAASESIQSKSNSDWLVSTCTTNTTTALHSLITKPVVSTTAKTNTANVNNTSTNTNASNSNCNSFAGGMSPSRMIRKNGQPLPLSKPPPRHPAPDPPSVAGPIRGLGQNQKPMHPQSTTVARINAAIAATSANAKTGVGARPNVALPSTYLPFSPGGATPLRPLPSVVASASASAPVVPSNLVNTTPAGTGTTTETNTPPNALPFQSEGLLSPPPTGGWKSPSAHTGGNGSVLSPSSSTGPDSAQLWNEIEQMMDPCMMSTIPGLHLSTALPPGARDVLKSARLAGGFGATGTVGQGQGSDSRMDEGSLPSDSLKTVGDLVGESPTGSYAEGHVQNREEKSGDGEKGDKEERDGESDESELLDDDPYEGVVQSVIARPVVEPLGLSLRTGRPAQVPLVKVSKSTSVSRDGKEEGEDENQGLLSVEKEGTNRDSIRSSTSTITITGYASPPRIVKAVSVIKRTGAYVIDNDKMEGSVSLLKQSISSPGGSSDGSAGSGSSGSPMQENLTPTTDAGVASPLFYYLDGTQTPSPRYGFDLPGLSNDKYDETDAMSESAIMRAHATIHGGLNHTRPTIVINDATSPIATSRSTETIPLSGATPLSPFQRYRGWLSAVVAPLEAFIDDSVDPREHYLDLREIAEGESGSVFSARLNSDNAEKLRLEPLVKAQDGNAIAIGQTKYVAIKSIAIVPSGSPKLVDLQRELTLMQGLWHEHVLCMDAVYVDLVEDSLWVRMELMERSLADMIGLVAEGLMLQDRMMARFAGDVCCVPFL